MCSSDLKDKFYAGENGIDAAITANKLDALLIPGGGASSIGALAGYPAITVPFAMVTNPRAPAEEADNKSRPFGLSFLGQQCAEPKLLGLAFAFEHRGRSPSRAPRDAYRDCPARSTRSRRPDGAKAK